MLELSNLVGGEKSAPIQQLTTICTALKRRQLSGTHGTFELERASYLFLYSGGGLFHVGWNWIALISFYHIL